MRKYLLALLALTASLSVFCQDFSNKGKDFWVGYGYHQVMTGNNGQEMVLYFASELPAIVRVEIPALGYVQNYTVAANSVTTSNPLPKAGTQDCRLLNASTAPEDKGIHITSDRPIVAYAHIYNASVSGATILFPTNTLGKEYYSINYKNVSNSPSSNCWFYVVAADTGTTTVEITPSANAIGHPVGVPFTVNLTQGQVYNVMGELTGNTGTTYTGEDLSGSLIKSIASGTGNCKKIAVFSGSGRISITCNTGSSSSDNYMVQSFPKTAWGKKFLTTTGSGANSRNIYRVCVGNPATVVKINGGVTALPLINNFYYEIASSTVSNVIEADQPITVAQYFTSQGQCSNTGNTDPEVIYLSPVEQNINKVIWNATTNFNITSHYFNAIIPNAGTAISSFKLRDAGGTVLAINAFSLHPQDGAYSFIKQQLPGAGIYSIESDSGFNAIAYGFGNAESYGYNAGTNIKDLYRFAGTLNPNAIEFGDYATAGTPFYFTITYPYQPLSLYWDFHDPLIPNVTIANPATILDSTYFVGTQQVWRYKLPNPYTYNIPGDYPITVVSTTTNADGCGNTQEFDYILHVIAPPAADFTWLNNGGVTDSVAFFDATVSVKPAYKWFWDFGDPASGLNNTSIVKNPKHLFSAPGTYNVSLYIINTIGAISPVIIKPITVTLVPKANFGMSGPVCAGKPITFSDTSVAYAPGTLDKWNWNFGDAVTVVRNNGTDTTHIYNPWNASVTATLQVETNSGCKSPVFSRTFKVHPNPLANFTMPAGICLPAGSTQFNSTSTLADGTIATATYLWNFGDPPSGAANSDIIQNPIHFYTGTGPFTIKLQVTSLAGCIHDTTKILSTVYAQAQAAFTQPAAVCLGTPTNFTSSSNPLAGNTIQTYQWDFGEPASGINNTSTLATPAHTYLTAGPFVVKHWIVTDKGCNSDTATQTVTVNVIPAITGVVSVGPTTCSGTNGTITLSGLLPAQTYTINYNKNAAAQPTLTLAADAGGNIIITGLTAGNYTNINCTANNCTSLNAAAQVLNDPPLPATPTSGSNGPICSGSTLTLSTPAVANAIYAWTGPNGFTSASQNPSITNATTAATGAYTLTVTVNNCTSLVSAPLNVVVNQLPIISNTVATNPTTCGGNNGFITISGLTAGQTFTVNYAKNAVAQAVLSLTADAAGNVVITGLTAGTYTGINCTANNCTSTDAPAQLLSDPSAPAAPTSSSNSPVCAGTALNLSTPNLANATYSWSGPNAFTSSVQNPSIASASLAAAGNYFVSVTVNNCTSAASAPLNVIVNPVPAITAAVSAGPTTCSGADGNITLSGLTAGQTYTVNYIKNGTAQTPLSLTASAGGAIIISGLTAGTYTGINCTANACTSANAATQVLSDPALPAAPTPGSNGPICEGSNLTLTASAIAGASTYTWSGPNAFSSSSQNPVIAAATTAATGVYTVTATVNNCVSLASVPLNVVVNVVPAISSAVPLNPTTCSGTNGSITLNGLLAGQTYTVNYQKNAVAQPVLSLTANAAGSVVITGLTAGTYTNINCTANNCTSANAATQVLNDPAAPAAPSASSNGPICAGATLNLFTPALANATYAWTGPNAFASATQNPGISNATVAASGNYNIAVTVNNCTSAVTTIPVVVNALPTGNFNNSTPVCETKTISFTDLSVPNSGAVNGWQWNFGDPASGAANTSTVQNPTHSFAAVGNYTVSLIATTNVGCTSTLFSKPVTISAQPLAGFILPEVCLSDAFAQFVDTSKIASGTLTGWAWNFGDPASGVLNTSTAQNAQHKYNAVGNYIVSLTVTSNNGCSETLAQPITVNGDIPIANFTPLNTATMCANDSIAIQDGSTVNFGSVTKVEIYWDNLGAPTVFQLDNDPTPGKIYKHKYPNFQNPLTRSFTIRYRAYSGGTCVNDRVRTIVVNAAPAVQFVAMPPACLDAAPFQVTQATETGGVPGMGVYTGPGVSATGMFNPAAAGIGIHTIRYTYTATAGGCTDFKDQTVEVLTAPTANFSFAGPSCVTKAITFTGSATAAAGTGTLTTWTWDFGDLTPPVITNSNAPFTHTYAATGLYNVTLRVTTNNGCNSGIKTLPVDVKPLPVVDFGMPKVCLPNANTAFNDLSTIADGTQNAFTYLWNFDDPGSGVNNTSVAKNAAHIYNAVGPYNVSLTVTSGAGCVTQRTKLYNDIHDQPKADFIVSDLDGVCIKDVISFTDNSDYKDGTPVSWFWSLGDGTTVTTQNITNYLYSTARTYDVKLVIENSQGCKSDTTTKQFTVHPYPVVDAGPDRFVLEGGTVVLEPNVTGNDLVYLWSPGIFLNDPRAAKPVFQAGADQTYTLLVTARGGCSATDKVFVKVLKAPQIPNTFTPNNDGINDFWSIDYLNTYPSNRVQVFTRTGQLVFESRGYNKPWDGTIKGKPLPFDTYYYIIEPGNGRKPMTGYVTIIK
jgi:gliding motility-associated-like protein